ncbi:sarcosine oxidase subunit gamma [Paraburkholderia sp. J63]|uniref:sarcosine oxidase subunit gamma n=1 Tax=Paraburkholderia sp. J63 TaxID=2805434 RepID=UPI002ABE687E|nr:sarcosine oxidase subunit gamma family protein [Paraburkholderia sp. J63]
MSELAARSLTATQWAPPGRFPVGTPNLSIEELPLAGIVRLQSRLDESGWLVRLAAAAGVSALPDTGCCTVVTPAEHFIAWSAPREWLVFCPLAEEAQRLEALEILCDDSLAVATLISDSRVGFRATGADAPALLAKGTALNLETDAFPPGSAAATRFAGLAATIVHRVPGEYLVYFDVAYSEFLMRWWLDAADEFFAATR